MIFDWNPNNDLYHIMIPISSKHNNNLQYVIASCIDPNIIKVPVPGNLDRHVTHIDNDNEFLYNDIPIELKTLCTDCFRINDPEKVKQELVLIKLQGKNYKAIL